MRRCSIKRCPHSSSTIHFLIKYFQVSCTHTPNSSPRHCNSTASPSYSRITKRQDENPLNHPPSRPPPPPHLRPQHRPRHPKHAWHRQSLSQRSLDLRRRPLRFRHRSSHRREQSLRCALQACPLWGFAFRGLWNRESGDLAD
jgi:hypothetical protein